MKIVVMAGGEGRRLRPVTCTVPKPMVKISGKPVIEYTFDLLLRYGFEEAVLTLGYLPRLLKRKYENGYMNLKLDFSLENEPLGTAGSVKNALHEVDDTVMVISGDGVCDFDLSGILRYHKASGAAVTIVAKKVEEPREYGLINVGEHNRIIGFTEKPSWSQAVSDLANTGLYIIEPEVLSMIPKNEKFDFAKDLFPILLDENIPMFCYVSDGYWCDIGSVESYLKCQCDALDGKFVTKKICINDSGAYEVIPPVYIGENTNISDGSVIGPYAVIGDNCSVGNGARIRYSIVDDNSFVSCASSVTGAVICSGASLKNESAVYENSVVGSGAVIGKNSIVKSNVKVWPGKIISNNCMVDKNVKFGNVKQCFISGEGVCKNSSVTVDSQFCLNLGRALSSINCGKRIAVATDGAKLSEIFAKAFAAGALSSGGAVWDFGHCFKEQIKFFVNVCQLNSGVYITTRNENEIYICGEGGLSITRTLERDIEYSLQNGEYFEASENEVKNVLKASYLHEYYDDALAEVGMNSLNGICAEVSCNNRFITTVLKKTFKKLGVKPSDDLLFLIDNNGTELRAFTPSGEIDHYRLLTIACYEEMKRGHDVAVAYDAPDFLDELAEKCSCKVHRYLSAPSDSSDSFARKLATHQFFSSDALFLAVKLLCVMKNSGLSLDELSQMLPDAFISAETVSVDYSPSYLLKVLNCEHVPSEKAEEGIRIFRDKGKVLVIPDRSGEDIRILAEAESVEVADELCADIAMLIESYNKNNINNSLT